MTLHVDDSEIQLHRFGRGHTDGDTVIYFPSLKVWSTRVFHSKEWGCSDTRLVVSHSRAVAQAMI
jgi:glyoxylase-like metal-dependent hydrolase (beta-lactamase superfamily II)